MVDVDRLEELEAKATPGPWIQDGANCLPWMVSPAKFEWSGRRIVVNPTKVDKTQMDCIDDAAFIAEIRNAAPALIREIRELRELLDYVAKELDETAHSNCPWCGFVIYGRDDHGDGCKFAKWQAALSPDMGEGTSL